MKEISIVILLFIPAVVCVAGEPVLLTDSMFDYVISFVPLYDGRVLFVNSQNELCTVSPEAPMEVSLWNTDWSAEDDGWSGAGYFASLSGSHDGRLVCFTRFVHLPGDLCDSDIVIHVPLAVIVCGADGSGGKAVALSQSVGSGPQFDFTMDSQCLYGQPIYMVEPNAESYVAQAIGEEYEMLEDFDMIRLDDGSRSSFNCNLSDGYCPNPYSDILSCGSYPPNEIFDIISNMELMRSPDEGTPMMDNWILPDAGFVNRNGKQLVQWIDGHTSENPGESFTVYCMLPGDRHLFSRDMGESVFIGILDWETFTIKDAIELPELAGHLPRYSTVALTRDLRGILFTQNRRSLYFAELPLQ